MQHDSSIFARKRHFTHSRASSYFLLSFFLLILRFSQKIQRASHSFGIGSNNMKIDYSCPNVCMPQQFLELPYVISSLEHVRREGVAQGMWGHSLGDIRPVRGLTYLILESRGVDMGSLLHPGSGYCGDFGCGEQPVPCQGTTPRFRVCLPSISSGRKTPSHAGSLESFFHCFWTAQRWLRSLPTMLCGRGRTRSCRAQGVCGEAFVPLAGSRAAPRVPSTPGNPSFSGCKASSTARRACLHCQSSRPCELSSAMYASSDRGAVSGTAFLAQNRLYCPIHRRKCGRCASGMPAFTKARS